MTQQRLVELAGAAHMELVSGVVQLRPEDAMVEAMLRGWRAQQAARGLKDDDTIGPRERLIRRFLAFTGEYPWAWSPGHMDEWSLQLTAEQHLAPSTIRSYQCSLRLFTEFLTDGRYGWAVACEQAFGPGKHPVVICHEWNTIAHLNDYEGNPEARPFTRQELQRFLDYADEQVERAVKSRRKGALAAYRDATLFKVVYGWGLHRTETSKLDLVDFGRNPAALEFGRYGMLNVRYGKAKKGQPPRRRNVASVMGWAVEAVTDYVENVRPRFGCADHPALWVTERGGRVKPAEINARFVAYRDALGLPEALVPHSMRHSYVTHLTEDGVDRRFIQAQVGHECDSSTAVYTVYPQESIDGHRAFITRRRELRPAEEYRTPTQEEWAEFTGHFEKRKLSAGTCARAFGTPCIHEHACIRCPMLRPDPAQRSRLEEIRDNLLDRIAEAEREGWAGEAEGLQISLAGARDKLSQITAPRPVNLGIPAFHEITGRQTQPT